MRRGERKGGRSQCRWRQRGDSAPCAKHTVWSKRPIQSKNFLPTQRSVAGCVVPFERQGMDPQQVLRRCARRGSNPRPPAPRPRNGFRVGLLCVRHYLGGWREKWVFLNGGISLLTCRGQDFSFSERLAPKADRSTSQKIHLTQCECGALMCFCVRPESNCFAIGTSFLKNLHLVDQGPRVLLKRVQVQDERGCPDARKGLADPRDGNLRRRPPRHLSLSLSLSLCQCLEARKRNPSSADPHLRHFVRDVLKQSSFGPFFGPNWQPAGGVRARTVQLLATSARGGLMLRDAMRALRLRFRQKPSQRVQPRPTGVAVLGLDSQTRLVSTQTLAK